LQAYGSKGEEIQEHGTSICLIWGKDFMLNHNVVATKKRKGAHAREAHMTEERKKESYVNIM
jgi:hypothetical protein